MKDYDNYNKKLSKRVKGYLILGIIILGIILVIELIGNITGNI